MIIKLSLNYALSEEKNKTALSSSLSKGKDVHVENCNVDIISGMGH